VGARGSGRVAGYWGWNSLPADSMSDAQLLLMVTGAILSLLLSVIAFFLKYLIQDFRKLQEDFLELKVRQESLRAEIDRISEVLLLLRKQLIRNAK
jgi:phage-related minor tail protein